MDNLQSEQARRVWSRVHPDPEPSALEGLITREWAISAACPALIRRMGGKNAPLMQLLARRSRSRWACLQGMVIVSSGKRPPHVHPQIPQGSAGELLRAMCVQSLETAGLYQKLSREEGPVPEHLHREQLRDCARLLELLGNWNEG